MRVQWSYETEYTVCEKVIQLYVIDKVKITFDQFYEYVNTLRVEYAKNLQLNSQYSVLDIAMQCGFQSQQTFNRVFKEICGMTPLAYRKRSFAV